MAALGGLLDEPFNVVLVLSRPASRDTGTQRALPGTEPAWQTHKVALVGDHPPGSSHDLNLVPRRVACREPHRPHDAHPQNAPLVDSQKEAPSGGDRKPSLQQRQIAGSPGRQPDVCSGIGVPATAIEAVGY